MRFFRITKTLIFGILLTASLSLNIATVAFSSVAMLVSSAYEAVTGAASVAGSLRRDVDAKTNKIATLADELDLKNRQIASLSDEVVSLKQARKVTYRGQTRLLSEAVEDTTHRVSRRMAAGATRNAGSVVAEAIPIAGIAVIIGVTAWDIKDSCDTMKDLHELDLAFNPSAALDPEATEVCGMQVPTKDEVWQAVRSSPGKAWNGAKTYLPDLPDLTTAWDSAADYIPDLPKIGMPKIDWTFWD